MRKLAAPLHAIRKWHCCFLVAFAIGCSTHGGSATETPIAPDQGSRGQPQAEPGTEVTTTRTVTPHDDARTKSAVAGDPGNVGAGTALTPKPGHELAAFAAGCFWGVEDAFRKLPGVTATAVGFTGGHVKHPTYDRVCDHDTGHAEAVLVEFDPARISYAKLLKAFFQIHDPTTVDRQGPDVGDQYRSEIFTFSPAQADAAKGAIAEAQKRFSERISTKVETLGEFWKAEDYHQQYAEKNGYHGCPTGKLDGLL